jgi:hypothetical protein
VNATLSRVAAKLRALSARLSDDALAPVYKCEPMRVTHFIQLEAAYWLDKVAGLIERVLGR